MLKSSAFYLDKQKSLIPKKIEVYHVPQIALISAKRWRLDVLTFLKIIPNSAGPDLYCELTPFAHHTNAMAKASQVSKNGRRVLQGKL